MGKINYHAIYEKNKHDWFAMTEEPQKYEALLAGHYSDSNHFVYELLQNAEDVRASKVVIEYYCDKLIFYHNGKPFDEDDVRGVSSMLMGTKSRDDASTIGKFGMGFKSVFKYTYQPEIYSDEEGFIIQNYLLPKEVNNNWDFRKIKEEFNYSDGSKKVYVFANCEHLTKIIIPFNKIDSKGKLSYVSGNDVMDKLEGLSGEILLFLTYIQDLYWINKEVGKYAHITLSKDSKDENLITCRISGNNSDRKEDISKYLKYKDVFDHPEMKNAEVSVAYKVNSLAKNVNEINSSPIWVYFPTRDNTRLPFLIQGSFETAVSREKLMTPSDFNNVLFNRLGTLIAESMEDLGRRGLITQNFIRRIILATFQDEVENNTIPGLSKKITKVFKSKPLVPDANGHSRMASDLKIAVPFSLAEQANSVLWIDAFDGVGDFVALNAEHELRFTEYYSWLRDKLEIPVFSFKDWAQKLCEQPERTVSTTDGTLDELKTFYSFISEYQDNYYNNERTNSRAGVYEATIRGCLPGAWEYLREAPIVLNAENRMIPAYKDDMLQIYLSSSSKYRTILNSKIVSRHIAKDYHKLLSEGLKIAEFDNYQFVKEKVIQKYVESIDGGIGFEDVEDLKQIFSLFDEVDDADEVRQMLKDAYIIKVKNENENENESREEFAKPETVYIEHSDEGIDLSVYYHPITLAYDDGEEDEDGNIIYTDSDELYDFGLQHIDTKYYETNGISISQLKKLGLVTTPIVEGNRCGRGHGDDYWDALGEFCPFINIDCLEDNLEYIETHIDSELAKKKSSEILKLLLIISKKLKGSIKRRQRNPYTKEETADLLETINAYKWLFDKSEKLYPPIELSRFDLDENIYDDIPINKHGFEILGFVEKDVDVKAETFEKVQALDRKDKKIVFRQLAKELGYDPDFFEKKQVQNNIPYVDDDVNNEVFDPISWISDEFPQHRVNDFENLTGHVRRQFFFADPVKYEKVMRQIRTSKSQKAVRAYTIGMYLNESGVNICQMCKKPSRHVDAVEIANFGIEMPQLNLSLCPYCARVYKELRDVSKDYFREKIRNAILELDVKKIEDDYKIEISKDEIIDFTQTHIAEVKEIIKLIDEYGVPESQNKDIDSEAHPKKQVKDEKTIGTDNLHDRVDVNILNEGDMVQNAKYGQGTIVNIDTIMNHIDVEFENAGRKTFEVPTCFEKGFLKLITKSDDANSYTLLEEHNEVKSTNQLTLVRYFTESGFEVIDKRDRGGALWVVGTRKQIEDTVNEAESIFNVEGTYCDGGRAVGYRKSWFTRSKK